MKVILVLLGFFVGLRGSLAVDCNILMYRLATFTGESNPQIDYQAHSMASLAVQADFFGPEPVSFLRNFAPDLNYLRRNHILQDSEPGIVLHTVSLDGRDGGFLKAKGPTTSVLEFLNHSYGDLAVPLIQANREGIQIASRKTEKSKAKSFSALKDKLNGLSDQYFHLQDGEVADYARETSGEPFPHWIAGEYAIKLPWNSVKIDFYNDYGEYRGYFVAMAWNPVTNELVYAGPDFVPVESADGAEGTVVPRGCGIPIDLRATQANCGLSAFSALVGVPTQTALKDFIPEWKTRPYLMWEDVAKGLTRFGWNPQKIWVTQTGHTTSPKKAFGKNKKGMVLVMFTRGGKSVKIGHWAAYANGKIYDINVPNDDGSSGGWITEQEWITHIVPSLYPVSAHANGFYISTILVP